MTEENKTFEIHKAVDSLDAIPEPLRDFYVEREGRYFLEDPKALRGAKKHFGDEAAKLKKQLAPWEKIAKIGKTPEEIEEALLHQPDPELGKKTESDAQNLLRQHQERWKQQEASLRKEIEERDNSLKSFIIDRELADALNGTKDEAGNWKVPGATTEGRYFLKKELASRIRIEERNGKRDYRIIQEDGETPMAGSNQDGMATFEDLVREAAMKYPSLFQGTGHGGSGASAGRTGGAATAKPRSKMSFEEKANYMATYGRDAYLKLPA